MKQKELLELRKKRAAIFKSIVGVLMCFASLLIVLFGRPEYYGYLDSYLILTVVAAIIVGFSGCYLAFMSYPKYLENQPGVKSLGGLNNKQRRKLGVALGLLGYFTNRF
ncbi:MAG: hypothetical protein LPH21_13555 [Shewanella sp.]|nr:hypothetical protein [Shewanella sp.]